MSPELKQKLKKALAGKTAVEMGQFQFINLDEIRERAGRDWPEIRAKTYEVSGHFIEKRLDDDDVLIRCQGGFLIIFSELGGVEAEAHVEEISEALNAFFLGERKLEDLRVEAEARRVPTDEFLSIVARTQAEDEPELEHASDYDDPETPAIAADASVQQEIEGPKGAKGGRWEKTQHDSASKTRDGAPVWPENGDPSKAWDNIVFRPVWDSRNSILLHNVCQARRSSAGRYVYGRETLLGQDSEDALHELDREVVLSAQKGFQARQAAGVTCSVIIPVHYETLSAVSDRMAYFSLLQAVPAPLRRFFQLRVDCIPDGAPIAQMQEVFRSMRHFGSIIIAELPFARKWDLKRFEGCGVSVFAALLPPPLAAAEPTEAVVVSLMDLVAAAKAHGAETQLDGLENAEYLNAGVSVGVRWFSGPAVSRDFSDPQPAVERQAGSLLSQAGDPGDDSDIAYL